MHTAMNLLSPYKEGNFLINWAAIRFTRTVHHGVIFKNFVTSQKRVSGCQQTIVSVKLHCLIVVVAEVYVFQCPRMDMP
jgi:hypothetical protein